MRVPNFAHEAASQIKLVCWTDTAQGHDGRGIAAGPASRDGLRLRAARQPVVLPTTRDTGPKSSAAWAFRRQYHKN